MPLTGVLPGWGLPDPVPGPGGDSRGPCRHRCGHHALSLAAAPPAARISLGDFLGFGWSCGTGKLLKRSIPERWTLPGRDPKAEYDVLAAYLRTYSDRTIRNVFWSANNYALPPEPAKPAAPSLIGTARRKQRPGAGISALSGTISRMSDRLRPQDGPCRLVMLHPEEFYEQVMGF